jgi:hypothetical protein
MKLNSLKSLRVVTLISVLVAAITLWITRDTDYPSQSYSASASNVFFYYWMHSAIMATFILDFLDSKIKTGRFRWFSLLIPIFGIGVLVWDMHNFPVKHNVSTALLMMAAVTNLIYYARSKMERIYAIVLCFVGAVMFPLGLLSEVSLFWAEVIAEGCISIGMARRIYLDDYR